MADREPDQRHLFYAAVDSLNSAYKELGDAADCLRGIVDIEFLRAIDRAKTAINEAKEVIRA